MANGNRLLSIGGVMEIRKLYDMGFLSQREIGEMCGVSRLAIKHVVLGLRRSWSHA